MADKGNDEKKGTSHNDPSKSEKKKGKITKFSSKLQFEEDKKKVFPTSDFDRSDESFTSALSYNLVSSDNKTESEGGLNFSQELPQVSLLKKYILTPLKHSQPRNVSKVACLSKTEAGLLETEKPIFISTVSSSRQLFEVLKHSPTSSEADLNLINATHMRKIDAVKRAIKNGANVNTCRDRQTPLLIATETGDLRMVRYLLRVPNVNPNFRNVFGETPLIIAVRSGFNQIVRQLLNHDADVNISDDMGKTPLHEALFQGRDNLAKILLAFGANCDQEDCLGERPMYTSAVKKPNLDCLLVLLRVGASPEYFNITGISLLSRAIMNWTEFHIIETLVKYGASVNAQDFVTEKAPLHFAAIINDVKITKFLLSKGANTNLKTIYNFTPYDEAIFHKNLEVAECLVNITENANVKAFRALKYKE